MESETNIHTGTLFHFNTRGAQPKNLCGRAHVIKNINYGGRALIKTLRLLYEDTLYSL